MSRDLVRELHLPSGPSIVLLVMDGLGDLASASTSFRTPLEAARTPNLDSICPQSILGRLWPVAPGITPGSGPAHLALFGYDPIDVQVGRGVIEALGLDMDFRPGDIAARANFATIDAAGRVSDRRAGRISDELNRTLCAKLQDVELGSSITVEVRSGKSHRFAVVFRGPGLEGPLADSDPGREGELVRSVAPIVPNAASLATAGVINRFLTEAHARLADDTPANGVLLRGIGGLPTIPSFAERFGLHPAAIASYPMYRGLAQLVGMTKVPTADGARAEFETYRSLAAAYDFVFIHIKATDMHGEDGNFDGKVAAIEAVDAALPLLLRDPPGVLAITGDHATPVSYRGHGWQAVPVLVHAERGGADGIARFTERAAISGSLGTLRMKELMPVLLAAAGRLAKYGA
jgi:2,3-bisphosphoglycerate-independent phosphoglycerate mutase